jgi:hypothetical protein
VNDELDPVARYGMAIGLPVLPRTVLVEGTTDMDLFALAARLEGDVADPPLIGQEFAILAAGERDRGGATGVVRELIALRGMARTYLLPNGRPRYRFVALFDNDDAGRKAVSLARQLDNSIVEYKDLLRLQPAMSLPGSLDPGDMRRTFDRENAGFRGLDWEIEDLLPESFVDAFLAEHPNAVRRTSTMNGKIHRDFTSDGKADFHRFVKKHAIREDLATVIEVLKVLRYYLGVK